MPAELHQYSVHGLVIASELELPELEPRREMGHAHPDVSFSLRSLPEFRNACPTPVPHLRNADGDALFDFKDAARYLVRAGREVFIDPHEGADAASVRLFLFGSIMGAIFHQRRLLALHASAVAFGDHVVAFTGHQGVGKSTIAAHCVAAGGRLMADDIAVLATDGAGPVIAYPGMPNVKLWRDALTSLGRDTDGLVPDWFRAGKFHLPSEPATEPRPLRRLYVLEPDEAAGNGRFTRLTGAVAADTIIRNTYRIEYIDAFGCRDAHFRQCVQVASKAEIFRLARSRNHEQLPATAARVVELCTC
jgi:hypothetical protein